MQSPNRTLGWLGGSSARAWRGATFAVAVVVVAFALLVPSVALAIDPPVNFADVTLEGAVRVAINKMSGQLYASDLASLTVLSDPWDGIQQLDGLEYASNLTTIDLSYNAITTITPIAGLTGLTSLNLRGNTITDLPTSRLRRACPTST